MALQCLIFDCDGVILESVAVKNAAFTRICREIAPAYEKLFSAYVELHGAYFADGPCPCGPDLTKLNDFLEAMAAH